MSDWITYVKKYAAANGLTYKQALAEASSSYKKETKKAGIIPKKEKQIQPKNRYYDSESEDESEDESEELFHKVKKNNKKYESETDSEDISEEETNTEDSEYNNSDDDDTDYDSEDHTYYY